MRNTTNTLRDLVIGMWIAVSSTAAMAGEVSFFGEGIDYWKETTRAVPPEPETAEAPQPTPAKPESARQPAASESDDKEKRSASEGFDWRPFLDAKNKEFFREGDYTPPEPFMEIVRNPSDANLRMWFAYVERKNELTQRLAERMNEYLRENGGAMAPEAQARVRDVATALPRGEAQAYRKLRFRMYFDSTCPHCKRMFATLDELQQRGYFVEARQVDRGPVQHLHSTVPIVPASADELRRFRVSSVPLLLVGDLQHQSVYRQSGFMTADQVLSAIQGR